MALDLKFLKHLEKSKKIAKALPVMLMMGIFGGFFIALLAIFLRKKRKRDTQAQLGVNHAERDTNIRMHTNDTNKEQ